MKTIVFPATPIDTTGLATEAKQDVQIAEAQTANTELVDINTELNTQTIELLSINTELNTQTTELQAINTELNTQTVELQDINTELNNISNQVARKTVRELTAFIDTSVTNIPASSSLPLQVIASTAHNTFKIVSVEDIGEFIGVYTGAVSSEVLVAVLPLGGGELELHITPNTRLSLRNMKNSAITSGNIVIQLLG